MKERNLNLALIFFCIALLMLVVMIALSRAVQAHDFVREASFMGWNDCWFSSHEVYNGSFEFSDGWENINLEGPETVERSAVWAECGTSWLINVDGPSEGIRSNVFTVVSGADYEVTVTMRKVSGTGNLLTLDQSNRVNFQFTQSAVGTQTHIDTITATSSGTEQIVIRSAGGDIVSYADNLSVKRLP